MSGKMHYVYPVRIYRVAEHIRCRRAPDLKVMPVIKLPNAYLAYSNPEEYLRILQLKFNIRIVINNRQLSKLVSRIKQLSDDRVLQTCLDREHLRQFLTGETNNFMGRDYLPVVDDTNAFIEATVNAIQDLKNKRILRSDFQRGKYYFKGLRDL